MGGAAPPEYEHPSGRAAPGVNSGRPPTEKREGGAAPCSLGVTGDRQRAAPVPDSVRLLRGAAQSCPWPNRSPNTCPAPTTSTATPGRGPHHHHSR